MKARAVIYLILGLTNLPHSAALQRQLAPKPPRPEFSDERFAPMVSAFKPAEVQDAKLPQYSKVLSQFDIEFHAGRERVQITSPEQYRAACEAFQKGDALILTHKRSQMQFTGFEPAMNVVSGFSSGERSRGGVPGVLDELQFRTADAQQSPAQSTHQLTYSNGQWSSVAGPFENGPYEAAPAKRNGEYVYETRQYVSQCGPFENGVGGSNFDNGWQEATQLRVNTYYLEGLAPYNPNNPQPTINEIRSQLAQLGVWMPQTFPTFLSSYEHQGNDEQQTKWMIRIYQYYNANGELVPGPSPQNPNRFWSWSVSAFCWRDTEAYPRNPENFPYLTHGAAALTSARFTNPQHTQAEKTYNGASFGEFYWNQDSQTYDLVNPCLDNLELESTAVGPRGRAVREHYGVFIAGTQSDPSIILKGDAGQPVKLKIFNILGQAVSEWDLRLGGNGEHEVKVDAGRLPSGAYFATMSAGEISKSAKFILAK